MANSVDWEARHKKTEAITGRLHNKLEQFKKANHKELRMWWYCENYPPRLLLFVTFDGYNSVPLTGLDKLTEIATTIAEAGLSKCRKYSKGNEVSYSFWLPMDGDK